MTASRLSADILPRLEAARLRAIEEAETCDRNGLNSGMNHAYGQATAFATCIEWLRAVSR